MRKVLSEMGEQRLVSVDDEGPAGAKSLGDLQFGAGDIFPRAEVLQVGCADVGDDRNIRAGGGSHGRDLAARTHAHFQDSGLGLPECARSDLFSRYAREPGVEDGRFGIGLGLVLIRSAAQQHGGTVLVDQPTESGTRVTMTLHIRPVSSDYVRSPILKVDYAGERDHGLLELSDVLPADLYKPQ